MELTSEENLQPSTLPSNDVGHHTEDVEPQLLNHEDTKTKSEITEEERRGILEVIAATGKFWHDWDTLRGILSIRLKQVLAEYPEAQVDQNQHSSSLGETYAELERRLDEALFSFTEGPPFTLQRLCEILLTARTIYPNLSKLALALEKNLLVTSTLAISVGPYPSTTVEKPDENDKGPVEAPAQSHQNGVEPEPEVVKADEDVEMADVEEVGEDSKKDDVKESTITEEIVNGAPETSGEEKSSTEPCVEEASPVREEPNSTS